ncbi:DUF7310 family coiled-coil domain-containing protein [Halosimplex amylolyticum]|uniref:DUF7310 family coiled-coil domain-containing protein n=1 Tax=Halosimplex amylolyticum TaxID=3396616 RepID=UPI003F554BB3
MSERDLEARVDAVERALTDDGTDLTDLRETADAVGEANELASRVDALEDRVDELEAGLQAVRGYAGNVRAVNREVERRASAALAKAEALETAVETGDTAAVETAGPARDTEKPPRQQSAASAPEPARAPAHSAGSDDESVRTGAEANHSVVVGPQSGTGVSPSGNGPASMDRSEHQSGRQTGGQPREQRDRRARRRSGSESESVAGVGSESVAGVGSESGTGSGPKPDPEDGVTGRVDPEGDDAEGGASGPDEAESQTEQFIERVRDAL